MSVGVAGPALPTEPEQVPHEHVVAFYDHDDELVEAALAHLTPGLTDGGGVVVVATPAHLRGLERHLAATGIDLAAHRASGTYRSFDARDLLGRFLVGGRPDPSAFRSVVGAVLGDAAHDGRPVRIFGEMVALLWDDGDVDGAIALESFWNDLAQEHTFHLFCGYPMGSVAAAAHLAPAATVCRQHSSVVTPRSYAIPVTGPRELPDEVARFFVPVPMAARAARRFVRETLSAWGDDDVSPDAELVASELVGNALLHARSAFRVSLTRGDDGIQLGVQDAEPAGTPTSGVRDDEATSGRGMGIVTTLSRRWGVERSDEAKTVWVDLEHPAVI